MPVSHDTGRDQPDEHMVVVLGHGGAVFESDIGGGQLVRQGERFGMAPAFHPELQKIWLGSVSVQIGQYQPLSGKPAEVD